MCDNCRQNANLEHSSDSDQGPYATLEHASQSFVEALCQEVRVCRSFWICDVDAAELTRVTFVGRRPTADVQSKC